MYFPRTNTPKSDLLYSRRSSSETSLLAFFIEFPFRSGGPSRADDADDIASFDMRDHEQSPRRRRAKGYKTALTDRMIRVVTGCRDGIEEHAGSYDSSRFGRFTLPGGANLLNSAITGSGLTQVLLGPLQALPDGSRPLTVYTVIVYTEIVLDKLEGFDWDAANVDHILRHAISPIEIEEVASRRSSSFPRRPSRAKIAGSFSAKQGWVATSPWSSPSAESCSAQ